MSVRLTRFFVVLIALGAWIRLIGAPLLMDEVLHERQIANLARGELRLLPRLEMLPGFHVVLAGIVRLTGLSSPELLRGLCLAISLFFLLGCHLFARENDRESADERLLLIFALPVLFPFLFLLYTDVLALSLLVYAAFAAKRDRPFEACLLCGLALFVRQNHFFWILLVAGLVPTRRDRWCWVALAGIVIGASLIYGGVAVNAPDAGLPLRPYLGNVLFLLFLLPLLFLPRLIFERRRIARLLRKIRIWAVTAVVFVLAFCFFSAPHPFNRFEGHLRTALILAIENDRLSRLDFSLLVALGVPVLASFDIRRREATLLGVCTVVSLLPLKLIEQRYFLPPLVFGLLLKESDSPATERAQIIYWIPLAFVFFEGIVAGWWFP